ncbi:phosphoheptose isomerase, partial [mine drainage metagenome]
MSARIGAEFDKSLGVLQHMAQDTALRAQVADVVVVAVAALRAGNKLLFAGNGGSAADAQHWAGELVSRFYFDRPGLPAIALTTDTSILTAIGNDYGYDYTFARQIEALGPYRRRVLRNLDLGQLEKHLRAIEAARARSVKTIGFTGQSGDAMAEHC